MRTKIHYVVPTCAPKVMQEKLLPSLKEFESVSDLVSFGFVFQKYSKEEIKQVLDECERYHLDCRYIETEYHYENGLIPFVKMRNDAAMLNPTAEIYGCIDDDCLYSKDYPYAVADVVKAIVEYFEINSKCGTIMVTARQPQGKIIANVYNQAICINLGLYIRNIYPNGNIVPPEISELIGPQEDVLVWKQRLADGYFSAICYANCGGHYETKPKNQSGHIVYGWGKAPILPGTVVNYLITTLQRVEFNFAPLRKNKLMPQDFIVKKR